MYELTMVFWIVLGALLQSSVLQGLYVQRRSDFTPGLVSEQCLQCICDTESGCKATGCQSDGTSDSCGYFKIKYDYWVDCGKPGIGWHECADDMACSSGCVQSYMTRYAKHYNCPLTCEGFAREHHGGAQGCHHTSTLTYWHEVQTHGC